MAKLKGTRMLRLLKRYPNVRGLKRVSRRGLEALQQVGPKTARRFHQALNNLEYDSEMAEVYAPMIEHTAARILELHQQIQRLETKLHSLAESVKEVRLLMSFDGCGRKLASRLFGEIGRVEWFVSRVIWSWMNNGLKGRRSGQRGEILTV